MSYIVTAQKSLIELWKIVIVSTEWFLELAIIALVLIGEERTDAL